MVGRTPLLLLCIILSIGTFCMAQSVPVQIDAGNATGIQPYQTYGGAKENISYATGNLNVSIPLLHISGRSGLDLSLAVIYDSKIWDVYATWDPSTLTQVYSWRFQAPWKMNIPQLKSSFGPSQPGTTINCNENFSATLADGSNHMFSGLLSGCYNIPKGGQPSPYPQADVLIGDSNDASFMRLDMSNSSDWIVYLKGGERIHFTPPSTQGGVLAAGILNATKIEDTNGNAITINDTLTTNGTLTITDTLGRVVTRVDNCPPCSSLTSSVISYKDSNGVSQTVTINYANTSLTGATFTLPTSSYRDSSPSSFPLISSIVLPTGRQFTFQYNGYGELTKVSYPEGGYTRYDYGLFSAYHVFASAAHRAPTQAVDFREITARHVCQTFAGNCTSSQEYTTTYAPTVGSAGLNNQYEQVTDPLNNVTVYQFNYQQPGSPYGVGYTAARELSRTISQGSSTPLRTITTAYNNLDSNGNPGPMSLPVSRTTTLTDVTPNQVTKTTWTYDTTTLNGTSWSIDNVLNQSDYDYGTAPNVGALLRQTVNTWLKVNPVNSVDYTANGLHILDRKLTENIENGSSTLFAQTQFKYDSYPSIAGSGAVQHDSVFGTGYTTRGNATSTSQWRNTDGAWLATTRTYDDAGNVLTSTDPESNTTTFSYADAWGNSICTPSGGNGAAYVTSVTNALQQITKHTYDSCSGTIASSTDPNNQPTTLSYDLLGRLTQTSYPDGGSTTYCYTDMGGSGCAQSTLPLEVVKTTAISSSVNEVSTSIFDGLGRLSQTQLNSDPGGTDYTLVTYDGIGRKSVVYNPTRCSAITSNCNSESTWGYTTTNYDALDRVTSTIEPDGSKVGYTYGLSCTVNGITQSGITVTDEAGNARQSCMDGLGRLTAVFEDPGSSPHLSYETDYAYDALSNLASVNQKGSNSTNARTRSFSYDSLSRLTGAVNPESGTISYTYDADGNVITKKAPSPNQPATGTAQVTTTHTYDALNRLTATSYSDTYSQNPTSPTVSFSYDQTSVGGVSPANPIGRLTSEAINFSNGTCAANVFSYDPRGRIVEAWPSTPTTCGTGSYPVPYSYDLMGDLTSIALAPGWTISYQYNGAGRPSVVTSSQNNSQHPGTLFTADPSIGYFPNGALHKAALGNGLTTTEAFNNRLQPCRMNLNSSGTALSTCSDSIPSSGNVQDFCYGYNTGTNCYTNTGTSDNGNIILMTGSGPQAFNRTYAYDSLNRFLTMTDSASGQNCKGLQETYDAWGNRTAQTTTSGSCLPFSAAATTQNQLVGYTYDAAGNLTYDGSRHYYYDAENRLIQMNGTFGTCSSPAWCYAYDAEGRRVERINNGATVDYVRDYTGNVVAEYEPSTSLRVGYVYLNGSLLAQYDSGTTYFVHPDNLGSTRLMTNVTAGVYDSMDYQPFGEQIAGGSGTLHKFTGKERDGESGLDMFGARYYGSSLGRFTTPDWATKPTDVPYANFGNPQSLNLYSYVNNNPATTRDPDGHDGEALLIGAGALVCPECGLVVLGGIAAAAVYENRDAISQSLRSMGQSASTFFSSDGEKTAPPTPLPANPDDLKGQGYGETSHPDAAAAGHRTFENPETGDKVRFDQGKPGAPGHEGEDHYHRYNPNSTGKHDQYLDANGKPVPRGSDPSHLKPQPTQAEPQSTEPVQRPQNALPEMREKSKEQQSYCNYPRSINLG